MKAMIAYKKQSCVTGKLLRQLLSLPRKRTQKRTKLDYFIRWGSSDHFPVQSKLELNTLEAVSNTTNKFKMLQILRQNDIPVPEFFSSANGSTGDVYIRDRLGVTRFDNVSNFNSNDLYFSTPIENKKREYRVHVFNSEIVSIYEKVPHDLDNVPKLFKSHNCHFRFTDPEISRCNKEGQEIAIKAVNSLGLLFGGVDLIKTSEGKFVVCEVNSAPSLNSVNIQRWIDKINQYVSSKLGDNNEMVSSN